MAYRNSKLIARCSNQSMSSILTSTSTKPQTKRITSSEETHRQNLNDLQNQLNHCKKRTLKSTLEPPVLQLLQENKSKQYKTKETLSPPHEIKTQKERLPQSPQKPITQITKIPPNTIKYERRNKPSIQASLPQKHPKIRSNPALNNPNT